MLPSTYIVMRIDGRGFHRFSDQYEFTKPNDLRALRLMNEAAKVVMHELTDVVIAYGDSDEYSFVLRKACNLFERRESKLVSTFASTFTAAYHQLWNQIMCGDGGKPLELSHMPTFDARAVVYPSKALVRDYLSWRQADCHINNLYNTTFWALVHGGQTRQAAADRLKDTFAKDKNEILFSEFGINYNNEPSIYRKGTILVRVLPSKDRDPAGLSDRQLQREEKKLKKAEVQELHEDLIGDGFWTERPWLLPE